MAGKILLVNGSPNEFGCTYTALKELEATLNANGVETELIYLGKNPVAGCIACGNCREKGFCFRKDIADDIIQRIDEFEGIVAGSPVYYGGPSGNLCSFLERVCFATESKLAGKLCASIASCRRGGASGAFMRMNQYFLNCSMIVVGSQYWNQVHGFTPDDVRKDEEGLQTMRTLGQNMAWLVKSIDAGRAAGVEFPEYEERIMTNFID